jgi:hypothetical protein
MWCAARGALAAAVKPPDELRPDSRLDQPVTLSVAYDSLEEFCARLHGLTQPAKEAPPAEGNPAAPSAPIEITCDPAIKDHKVVVRVREQPLREVMRQVAALFDFIWMQGPQEHPRYHLTQSAGRERRATDLRQRYLAEKEARYRQVFKETLRALRATPDELAELAKRDPEAVARVVYYGDTYAAFTALDDALADAILDGKPVVLPFTALPAAAQATVKERFRRADYLGDKDVERDDAWLWDGARVTYERSRRLQAILITMDVPRATGADPITGWPLGSFAPQVPWSRLARLLERADDSSVPRGSEWRSKLDRLETQYGVNIIEKARHQATDAVPAWARTEPMAEAPKASGRLVSIGMRPRTLPLLLLAVADQLDLNLAADCHWTHRETMSFGLGEPESRYAPIYPSLTDAKRNYYVDGNPEYTFARICETQGRGWVRDGDFFRVRDPLWFVDDAEEVPASVLREWMRRTHDEERVDVQDYLYLVSALSPRLAENTVYTEYGGDSLHPILLRNVRGVAASQYYHAMKLYGLLPPALQVQAQQSGIDVNTELPRDLRPLVETMLAAETPARNPDPQEPFVLPANLRLWAGYRLRQLYGDEVGEGQSPFIRCFSIELWTWGRPDWSDDNRQQGRLCHWGYDLYRLEPPKQPTTQAKPEGDQPGASH